MKDCIFCKIVKGEIPSEKIWEDEEFLAIIDAFPIMQGQVLVIPKKHIEPYVFGLEDETYSQIMLAAKKVTKKIDESLKPIKTGMIIEGLEVPHIHLKLLPLMTEKGYGLETIHPAPSKEELKQIADKMRN